MIKLKCILQPQKIQNRDGGKFMFDIQEELKKLPAKPGVYLMHNSKDEIIMLEKRSSYVIVCVSTFRTAGISP